MDNEQKIDDALVLGDIDAMVLLAKRFPTGGANGAGVLIFDAIDYLGNRARYERRRAIAEGAAGPELRTLAVAA